MRCLQDDATRIEFVMRRRYGAARAARSERTRVAAREKREARSAATQAPRLPRCRAFVFALRHAIHAYQMLLRAFAATLPLCAAATATAYCPPLH